MLHFRESPCKSDGGIVQTAHTTAEEELHRRIESVPEEKVTNINRFAIPTQFVDQDLIVVFEDVQVAETVFDKLGPDQLA